MFNFLPPARDYMSYFALMGQYEITYVATVGGGSVLSIFVISHAKVYKAKCL